LQAEKDTAARIERERVAAEERKAAQERAAAAEKARVESLRPDVEKINAFALTLQRIAMPDVTTQAGEVFVDRIRTALIQLSKECAGFKA
jgi:hypothetical protein